jgi:hypothetical protein
LNCALRMTAMAKAFWPVSFVLLANLPGRYAMAVRDGHFGRDVTSTFVMALLADVACLAPLVALALVPADWIATRRPETRLALRCGVVTAVSTVVLVSALMWVVSVGATEFRIQRGTYPTLLETFEGLADATFIRGSAKIALFERYSQPTLLAVFALTGLLVVYARDRLRPRSIPAGKRTLQYGNPQSKVFAVLGPAVASLGWATAAAAIFISIHVVAPRPLASGLLPPVVRLAFDVVSPRLVSRHAGVRSVLESTDLDETLVRRGLHRLGFGDSHARCLVGTSTEAECRPHPLARPLPGDVSDVHIAGDRAEEPTPLVRAFLALSSALFEQRDEPITVWHVVLESFRADDVHALNPSAPREIAPFVNAAYDETPDETLSAGRRTVAFRHAYQSGLRTAQAVSGLWCGLGALPFQLALSRDLVDLPLRCAPDVLRDAGFETHLYYGSNASFERLGEFAQRHGVTVTDLSTLPPGLPRGAFRAVTDAALLRSALQQPTGGGSLAYRFVLTLSGHTPFDLPEDMTPTTAGTIDAILARSRVSFAGEDRRRLATMHYTDGALAAFVKEIERSPRASQTILLVSADHATADPALWGAQTVQALARVPLFVYLPAGLVAACKNPSRIDQEIRSLQELASALPVSINDVPTLLLALLARHNAFVQLPPAMRWHTLGGATSSRNFGERASRTTAQVWGIDALSRVFLVRADAADQPLDTGERSVAFSVWDDPLGPLLKDVSGALSAVLRACPVNCAGMPE